MTAFVLIVVLGGMGLSLLPLARLVASLPDSNEDFVFVTAEADDASTRTNAKTVIPAQA